jgi:DNA invertase Pin-like site-specific DNA recombinase
VNLLAELQEEGVGLYLHQQQVDSTTTAGKAMLGMCAVFAEFEWNSISDRVKAGIERARKEGKRIGRPSSVTTKTRARILKLRAQGMGMIAIARTVGCGTGTVQKTLAEAKK